MTAQAGPRTRAGWTTRVGGEIVALTVRREGSPAVVVATEDGSAWWIDATGSVTARTASDVDLPTSVSIHPHKDVVALSGARGYATWELGRDPIRHGTAWSSEVRFNRSGDLAAASGKYVAIHHEDGRPAYLSDAAPSTISGVAWTTQQNRVAASAYGGVYVYDGKGPTPTRTHPYAGSHLAVATNPNGRWVCSGNQDASVHIWRTSDNNELEMSGYPEKVTRLAFDDTGRWFANNGAPEVSVWDFIGPGPRGRQPRMLTGHRRVVDLAWRPGTGSVLASVGAEGSARVWTLAGSTRGTSRPAAQVLPVDDAVAVTWWDTTAVVVAGSGGAVTLVPWPSS